MLTSRNSIVALAVVFGPLTWSCTHASSAKPHPPQPSSVTSTSQTNAEELPDAQLVLSRAVNAMGGRAAIDEIETYAMERRNTQPGGTGLISERTWWRGGDFAVQVGEPGRWTQEIWKQGDVWWARSPGSRLHRMEGAELTRAVLTYEFALPARWSAHFVDPRTTRRRTIAGESVLDVELDSTSGERVVLTFEEDSGHLVEASIRGPSDASPSYRVHFDGHHDYAGFVQQTASVVESNGEVLTRRMVAAFRMNVNVDDARIAVPSTSDPIIQSAVEITDMEGVCKKLRELMLGSKDTPDQLIDELPTIEECINKGIRERRRDPAKFDRGATCIVRSNDIQELLECATKTEQPNLKPPQ